MIRRPKLAPATGVDDSFGRQPCSGGTLDHVVGAVEQVVHAEGLSLQDAAKRLDSVSSVRFSCAETLFSFPWYVFSSPSGPSLRNPDFCSMTRIRPLGPTTTKSISPMTLKPCSMRVQ